MTINFNGTPVPGQAANSIDTNNFQNAIKAQPVDTLLNQYSQPRLEAWKKEAIAKEIVSQVPQPGAGGATAAGGDAAVRELQRLMKMLLDKTIRPEQSKRLARLTGSEPAKLEALKERRAEGAGNSEIVEPIDIRAEIGRASCRERV